MTPWTTTLVTELGLVGATTAHRTPSYLLLGKLLVEVSPVITPLDWVMLVRTLDESNKARLQVVLVVNPLLQTILVAGNQEPPPLWWSNLDKGVDRLDPVHKLC